MEFKIPVPLTLEHEELHAELARATRSGGKTAEAAKIVANMLHPHFVKEEEFALPPLGLLTRLGNGQLDPQMKDVLAMTDRLKADLPQMIAEHKSIVSALENLGRAAKEENKTEYARFVEKLKLHAQTEEEVLYPAAIMIGELVKLKLGK